MGGLGREHAGSVLERCRGGRGERLLTVGGRMTKDTATQRGDKFDIRRDEKKRGCTRGTC